MHRIGATLLSITLILPVSGACADTLSMPNAAQSTAVDGSFEMAMPARGMSMQRVEQRYGNPIRKIPPVGEPPIARWNYQDYTVYFEGRYVINSVLNSNGR